MRRYLPAVALTVLLVVLAPTPALHGQAPQSAGTRIGTIIKDAIDVALPNATKLIDAIFGRSDKATKADAKTAIDSQASTAKQASNAKLKELANISAELNVVSQYLEQTVPASQKVARMLTRLEDASGSSMPGGVKSDWDDLDKMLQKLGDIKPSDINKVDPGLRLRLLEIRGIYASNRSDIKTSLDKNDVGGLKGQLRAISALLNSVVSIAGIEITSLQDGFDSVLKSTGMTPQGGSPSARISSFSVAADNDLSAAKRTLTKK